MHKQSLACTILKILAY